MGPTLSLHKAETMLSPAALSIWAKSQDRRGEWLCLPQHLSDSASVAGALFGTWLAPAVRRNWSRDLPGGEADAVALITFLAGVHDVGKASPAFSVQVAGLSQVMRQHGLDMLESYTDRRLLPHALASHLALQSWLRKAGVGPALAKQLASVVGSHHGQTPTTVSVADGEERPELLGKGLWDDVRGELLSWMSDISNVSRRWSTWSELELPLPMLVGMTGLVVMADWIASNDAYFPLVPFGSDRTFLTPVEQQERTTTAWADVVMSPAWAPAVPAIDATELYAARFGWSDDRQARPVQILAEKLARETDPGLMIVEAPTGEGKTELALVVAEIVAARWGASGLYFALPTQATSNAVLTRLARWADRLPGPGGDSAPWSLTLAHGRSRLNQEFADMYPETAAPEIDRAELVRTDDESDPGVNYIAHEWFRGRKRTLLANFGVGTIDQLLFTGLQAKHLMLRHLGLAGKVVVIDEVHAADPYMNVFLDRALQWLRAYEVPVIVLSATLPGRRRAELLSAYASPLQRRAGRALVDSRFETARSDVGYPAVSTLALGSDEAIVHRVAAASDRRPTQVQVEMTTTSCQALVEQLTSFLAGGGCALVLRNTVKAAQVTAEVLRRADVGPVTLCHSQFLAADRNARDQNLLDLFGPTGARPDRHIVVSTQVVEQSLDVDFDIIWTDLPPADLLCQRLGRVHRHRRSRPALLSEPRCLVMLDDPSSLPPQADRGSSFIYGDAALHRTAAALHDIDFTLRVPDGVSAFVQHAYGDALPGPEAWHAAMAEADAKATTRLNNRRAKARTFLVSEPPAGSDKSMTGWLEHSVGDADPDARQRRATVRDGEDGLEVIVAPLDFVTGDVIVPPWQQEQPGRIDVRAPLTDLEARTVASWAIKLPASVTRPRMEEVIAELSNAPAVRRWSWHQHPWLRGELILPMRQTLEDAHVLMATLADITLRYTPDQGMEVVS